MRPWSKRRKSQNCVNLRSRIVTDHRRSEEDEDAQRNCMSNDRVDVGARRDAARRACTELCANPGNRAAAGSTGRSAGCPGYETNGPRRLTRREGQVQGGRREVSRGVPVGQAEHEAGRARERPRHQEGLVAATRERVAEDPRVFGDRAPDGVIAVFPGGPEQETSAPRAGGCAGRRRGAWSRRPCRYLSPISV